MHHQQEQHTSLASTIKERKSNFTSRSGRLLVHYDSTQTLAMAGSADLASNPGDSTTALAFPSPNERDALHSSREQQRVDKHKQSVPPTNPSSTAELIPLSIPSRGAPAWLLLLDRHWNPLACLWVGLSLLCILVLLVAVPTEPVQPAKITAVGMKSGHLQGEGCASVAGYMQYGEPELLGTSLVEGDTTPSMNFTCWDAPPNASTTAQVQNINTERHLQNTSAHIQAEAHPHAHRIPPEQLCLLLVALTVFLLPLPGYVLVGGRYWVELALNNSKKKSKDEKERKKKTKR